VPNGVLVEYARHPEKQALMISTMTAPKRNPDFAARELVYLDLRLVKHLRSFKIDTVGLPDDPLAVEFSVNLLGLYMQDGRPILLTRNKVSGLNYAFAKVGQPATGARPRPSRPACREAARQRAVSASPSRRSRSPRRSRSRRRRSTASGSARTA
jgi:hypothetical protein